MSDTPATSATIASRCPICRKPPVVQYRPFCSKRCADVDLSRWLNGAYVVAGAGADADEDGNDGGGSSDPGPGQTQADADGSSGDGGNDGGGGSD